MSEYTFTAKITSNGRITVPEHIREALNKEDGDLVEVEIGDV